MSNSRVRPGDEVVLEFANWNSDKNTIRGKAEEGRTYFNRAYADGLVGKSVGDTVTLGFPEFNDEQAKIVGIFG